MNRLDRSVRFALRPVISLTILGSLVGFIQQAAAQGQLEHGASSAAGNAPAVAPNPWKSSQEPLPSLDEALAKALENSPDIAAAQAKLALAQAELNGKRIEVSRQILALHSGLKNFETQSDVFKAKLQAAQAHLQQYQEQIKAGIAQPSSNLQTEAAAIHELEAQLSQIASQRDTVERELRLLLGSKPPASDHAPPTSATSLSATGRSPMSQGPAVDKVKAALDQLTDLEFADNPTSLKDFADYISTKHAFPIYIHPDIPAVKMLISSSIKDVPLRHAFEALQELNKGQIWFVVRDYGILIVNKDIADENGYVSAVEFGLDTSPSKPRPPAGPSGSGISR